MSAINGVHALLIMTGCYRNGDTCVSATKDGLRNRWNELQKKGNKRERARAEAGLPFCASVSSKETPLKAQQSAEKKKARGETAFPWWRHRLSFHAFASRTTRACSHLRHTRTYKYREHSHSHTDMLDTSSAPKLSELDKLDSIIEGCFK